MSSRKKKRDKRKEKQKQRDRSRPPKPWPTLSGTSDLGPITLLSGVAEKMSEVLLEFLEPYTELWKTEEDLRWLLPLGIVAWNTGLMTASERQKALQDTRETLPSDAREECMAIVAELIRRKESQFAWNKRAIVDYRFTMAPDGPHLQVVSTLDVE